MVTYFNSKIQIPIPFRFSNLYIPKDSSKKKVKMFITFVGLYKEYEMIYEMILIVTQFTTQISRLVHAFNKFSLTVVDLLLCARLSTNYIFHLC